MFPAFMFYLPGALWKVLRRHPFIPLRTLADAAVDYQHASDATTRERVGMFLGKHLGHFLWDIKSNTVTQIFTVSIQKYPSQFILKDIHLQVCMYIMYSISKNVFKTTMDY